MDKLIHENGVSFARSGKIKNIEILDFIRQDEFYHSKIYDRSLYRTLDILDGIDITTANEVFFEKWKQMNLPRFLPNYRKYYSRL